MLKCGYFCTIISKKFTVFRTKPCPANAGTATFPITNQRVVFRPLSLGLFRIPYAMVSRDGKIHKPKCQEAFGLSKGCRILLLTILVSAVKRVVRS
jgi:hypothetical protein